MTAEAIIPKGGNSLFCRGASWFDVKNNSIPNEVIHRKFLISVILSFDEKNHIGRKNKNPVNGPVPLKKMVYNVPYNPGLLIITEIMIFNRGGIYLIRT